MRVQHTPHSLPSFPVYSSAFLSSNELVLGGGGGATRSGIKNRIRLYHVGDDRKLDLVDEIELEKDEDAPMSMAANPETKSVICGVNSPTDKLEKGENENCRVYGVKEKKLCLLETQGTLMTGNLEDYQKVTVLSPDGKLVVAAGSRDLALLSFPTLLPVAHAIRVDKDIYDATFSPTALVIATTNNLLVYALPKETPAFPSPSKSRKKGKQKAIPLVDLELIRTVELPPLSGSTQGSTFRAARFHPHNDKIFYTVMNTMSPRSKKKTIPRQAFVCKWDTESWTVMKMRKVDDRGVTCFDVSPNGKFLGFGSSGYTIGLLDSITLGPLVTILKAHEFPPTTFRFNPTSTLLVSGSADNSVRVVSVPDLLGESSWGVLYVIVLTLLAILLAIAAQMLLGSR